MRSKPTNAMIKHKLQQIKESIERRRDAINYLNFTYRGLHVLLTMLVKRMSPPIASTLVHQMHEDNVIKERLHRVAQEHDHPPVPCSCDEANMLLEEVRHAERAKRDPSRASMVVTALQHVRAFLLRTWGRLINDIPEEQLPQFRKEAIALQLREAEQHRQLVSLRKQIEEPGRYERQEEDAA
jgi:hypothetical protein